MCWRRHPRPKGWRLGRENMIYTLYKKIKRQSTCPCESCDRQKIYEHAIPVARFSSYDLADKYMMDSVIGSSPDGHVYRKDSLLADGYYYLIKEDILPFNPTLSENTEV